MTLPAEATAAIKSLGYEAARPTQEEVLGHIFEGNDVLAVLPTAGGKTLLCQVPALARKGPVVVISPLVALMNDQVNRCKLSGMEAYALHSHCSAAEKRKATDAIEHGQCQLLFISPERLQGMDPTFFGDHKPQLFVMDEAHCVSEWGHDFRPPYMKIGRNLKKFGEVQKLCMTATATGRVQDEITRTCGLKNGFAKIVRSPDRPNVRYAFAGSKVPVVRMVQHVELPALVYGGTRRAVEEAARELRAAGYNATHYHAGMTKDERFETEAKFRANEVQIVCATCAFGMGIDHAGIRSVIHLEIPTSLEAYVQESGRAGRDGRPSVALCRATVDTLDTALQVSLLTWPEPKTVNRFRERLFAAFDVKKDRWEGSDRLQRTNEELANMLEVHPIEAGSCLRVLDEADIIRRIPYQERAVKVTLLKGARVKLRSERHKQILVRLADHADLTGEVAGTVSFFRDHVGMDKSEAERLSVAGALRYEWVDRCQMIERMDGAAERKIDGEKLKMMRLRTVSRIQSCRGFLSTKGCRRKFLLEYFEQVAEHAPVGVCCDRCRAKEAAV